MADKELFFLLVEDEMNPQTLVRSPNPNFEVWLHLDHFPLMGKEACVAMLFHGWF